MVKFYVDDASKHVEMVTKEVSELVLFNGKEMRLLKANSTDGAGEKHVPVIEQNGNKVTVKVGSVEHPMMEAHYITFICLETKKHVVKVDLTPADKPLAVFELEDGDEVVNAFEFCNLHGLWSVK